MAVADANREELLREHAERQRRQADEQTAREVASGAAMEGEFAAPGYWDMISDPGIARERSPDNIDEFLATELSKTNALGFLTREDWRKWMWKIESQFFPMQNEFRDQDSTLDDADMAAMYGETRPTLTDERARRLRSAQRSAQLHSSLSVNARGLRAGTEIHAVAKSETPTDGDDDQGSLMGTLKQKLV